MFWYKDVSCNYENEWLFKISLTDDEYNNLEKKDRHGLNILVDLEKLIEGIYPSPNMSEWKVETVKKILEEYNLTSKVFKSRSLK